MIVIYFRITINSLHYEFVAKIVIQSRPDDIQQIIYLVKCFSIFQKRVNKTPILRNKNYFFTNTLTSLKKKPLTKQTIHI